VEKDRGLPSRWTAERGVGEKSALRRLNVPSTIPGPGNCMEKGEMLAVFTTEDLGKLLSLENNSPTKNVEEEYLPQTKSQKAFYIDIEITYRKLDSMCS